MLWWSFNFLCAVSSMQQAFCLNPTLLIAVALSPGEAIHKVGNQLSGSHVKNTLFICLFFLLVWLGSGSLIELLLYTLCTQFCFFNRFVLLCFCCWTGQHLDLTLCRYHWERREWLTLWSLKQGEKNDVVFPYKINFCGSISQWLFKIMCIPWLPPKNTLEKLKSKFVG